MSSPRLSGRNEFVSLKEAELAVVTLKLSTDDEKTWNYLGDFYGRKLPQTTAGRLIDLAKPVGGDAR